MEKEVAANAPKEKINRYFALGRYYHKLQEFDKAIENYNLALESEPKNAEIYFNRGLAYIAKKAYSKAIADINKAIEVGGDFPEAHHALGNIFDQQQDFARAREEYNKAIRLSQQKNRGQGEELIEQEKGGAKKFDFLEKPKINFSHVAGLKEVKEIINESIVYPITNPKLAEKYGRVAGGGVIFYGPPGCGKTYIGKATAGECNASFLSVKISDIMDMYVGNTEKNIHAVFETARRNKPAIIFFDEIDGIGGRRDSMQQSFEKRSINQLLIELDGVEYSNEGVLVIGSTNAPWYIDPALRRAGRFSKFIYFPEPDKKAREEVFRLMLKDKPLDGSVRFGRLARLTEGYSIADIKAVCEEAASIPWKEALKTGRERKITMSDFLVATRKVKSSLPPWYTSVKKFLIQEEEKQPEEKGSFDGRTIVVKHKKAQEELLNEEERKLFSELIETIKKQSSLSYRILKKIRVWFARYVF